MMLQTVRRIALPIFSLVLFGNAANTLIQGNCEESALVLQKTEAKKSITAPNARILGISLESCQQLCKKNQMLDQSELACSAFVFQKVPGNCFFYSENPEPPSLVDSSDSDLYRKQCPRAPTASAGGSIENPNLLSSEFRPQATSTEESQKVEPAVPQATAPVTTGTANTVSKSTDGNVVSTETAQPRQADDDQEADYDAALEASSLADPSDAPAPEDVEAAPAKPPPRISAHMASSAEMQPPPPAAGPQVGVVPPPTIPAASRPIAAATSPAAPAAPILAGQIATKQPAAASAAVLPIATTKAPPIAPAVTAKPTPVAATAAKIAATVKPVSAAPVAQVGAATKLPQIIASAAPKVANTTTAPKAVVPAVGNATAKAAAPAAVLTTTGKPPVAASTAVKPAVTPYPIAANVTLPKAPVVPVGANATKPAPVLPAATLPVTKPGSVSVAQLQSTKAPPVAPPIYQTTTKPILAPTAAGQFTPKPVAAQVIGQVTLRALVIMVPLEGDHVDPRAFPEITQIVGNLPLGKAMPIAAGIGGKISNSSSETVGGVLSANRSVLGATQPPRSAEVAKDAANVTTAKFRISTHALVAQSAAVAVTLQPQRPPPTAAIPANPNGKRSSSEVAALPNQVASSEKSSEKGTPVANQEITNENLQGWQEEMGPNDEKDNSGLRRRNLNSCKYALKFFECLRAQKQIWMHHNANNAADVVVLV